MASKVCPHRSPYRYPLFPYHSLRPPSIVIPPPAHRSAPHATPQALAQYRGSLATPYGHPLNYHVLVFKQSPLLQVLTGIIQTTDVPFSSYIAHPRSPIHYVDARIKQVYLIAILLVIPRAPWEMRLGLVAAIALATIVCLPRRLWQAQMGRIAALALLLTVSTAFAADTATGTAIPHQPSMETVGLPDLTKLNTAYEYAPCLTWLEAVLAPSWLGANACYVVGSEMRRLLTPCLPGIWVL